MQTTRTDPVIAQARQELAAAKVPVGQRHDLRQDTLERSELRSIRPDMQTLKAYLQDASMPSVIVRIAK